MKKITKESREKTTPFPSKICNRRAGVCGDRPILNCTRHCYARCLASV